MQIAAIFDMDDTLLSDSSGRLLLQYLRQKGQLLQFFNRRNIVSLFTAPILYKLGLINVERFMQRSVQLAAGYDVDDLWTLVNTWFDEMLVNYVSEGGRTQLAWHRDQGHLPVICSASSQFSVLPVARHLGVDAIWTEWLSADGALTGLVREPITYGEGKVYWTERWAAEHNVDLSQSYFYSDHLSDVPLLELVGHPVAVNPTRQLTRYALKRNWPIEQWR